MTSVHLHGEEDVNGKRERRAGASGNAERSENAEKHFGSAPAAFRTTFTGAGTNGEHSRQDPVSFPHFSPPLFPERDRECDVALPA